MCEGKVGVEFQNIRFEKLYDTQVKKISTGQLGVPSDSRIHQIL